MTSLLNVEHMYGLGRVVAAKKQAIYQIRCGLLVTVELPLANVTTAKQIGHATSQCNIVRKRLLWHPCSNKKALSSKSRLCGIPSTTLLGCLGHCSLYLAHKPWVDQSQTVHWIIGRNLIVQDLVLDVTNT
jgi:hypothetical protein